MSAPLPTSPEVEAMECAVICTHGSLVYAAELHRLRAAQHVASRKAVLEEVRAVMDADNPLGNTPTHIVEQTRDWLDQQLTEAR